jgi:membrane-bound lytic murein transglycosylase D
MLTIYTSGRGVSYSTSTRSKKTFEKGQGIHVVQSGETISEIAELYDMGLSVILRLNGKSSRSVIRVGDELIVNGTGNKDTIALASRVQGPPLPPVKKPKPKGPSSEYVVRRGDSPWSIARKFGLSTSDLLAHNNMTGNSTIMPGDKLLIPSNGSSADSKIYHTVRRGDTLWEISNRYNVTVLELKRWNLIGDSHRLQVGDRLVVYSSGSSG